jgi:hypothetical protein
VAHVPEGPAGEIVIDVAATLPEASRCPLARKHSPIRRSAGDASEVFVTVAVVGTVIVWLPEPAASTVIEVPLAVVTSPAANAIAGCAGWSEGRGEAPAPGFGPGWPAPQPDAVFGDRRTVDAVSVPAESFCPVATRHAPGTMSTSTAVAVRLNVVLDVYVTVTSPLAPVRINVCPLI